MDYLPVEVVREIILHTNPSRERLQDLSVICRKFYRVSFQILAQRYIYSFSHTPLGIRELIQFSPLIKRIRYRDVPSPFIIYPESPQEIIFDQCPFEVAFCLLPQTVKRVRLSHTSYKRDVDSRVEVTVCE